ncbi:hypothetical protein LAZ67_4004360 [Cordylochernes scorpioides]|uniref:Transposase n=1 Tax=Cordylochernes scorpioides TaxID=51811 RepID=A0ABY6KHE4_9ARAC|nr:hypothetical protein LAZ67_4004360 [Cordylochernes scorpioides]
MFARQTFTQVKPRAKPIELGEFEALGTKIIKKRIQRNSRVSMSKIARETGIDKSSVHRIAKRKKKINLKMYKLQKAQLLTNENKRVRLERCRQLKHQATGQRWERVELKKFELYKFYCIIIGMHCYNKLKDSVNAQSASKTVSKAIRRFNELGHEGDRAGRGRKRTANLEIIKKRIQRNSRVSMRKIARETGISKSSRKKKKKPQGVQAPKTQHLKDENKRVRLERCHQLKHRATGQRWERILFTDEKLFTLKQAYNHQNDRSWPVEASGTSAKTGISAGGKTPLVFVDQGVNINQKVYRRDILKAIVLHGFNITSAMRIGRSNRTPRRLISRN